MRNSKLHKWKLSYNVYVMSNFTVDYPRSSLKESSIPILDSSHFYKKSVVDEELYNNISLWQFYRFWPISALFLLSSTRIIKRKCYSHCIVNNYTLTVVFFFCFASSSTSVLQEWSTIRPVIDGLHIFAYFAKVKFLRLCSLFLI